MYDNVEVPPSAHLQRTNSHYSIQANANMESLLFQILTKIKRDLFDSEYIVSSNFFQNKETFILIAIVAKFILRV